ncbi:hypothetical protein TVAG_362400 [Trichomonas vaginalis G3]|uniref:Uncharacterized protein n=1 Tax=Trichomonas vaginalis (strain ATCC PRA-98 / G3) TaxID=412133 RepID=A2E618_TRIV3|nr:hypothetical protein TVAGG3_0365970 [Trichomonas vaginalis G3]EAY11860.1 hypothetical protein TVAG_362400 [Trichomonas vaginalis G3]KAI5532270.1 hypothetical protein TVAGG3_0365970 [Trichomonas vaginalis G3]|eukprot:XP_001324083.1 hypothetical protein [Trichomonas vaginalis G3]
MCDIHESRVNDDKMVNDVSNQLQLSKLRQIFYRWADDAISLKKIHDKIRNVRKMMVNSSLNRYFSKWVSNYSISKFNREKTQEYIEKSTNTLLKRSFTRWGALFKSTVATKDLRNKISWFIKKNYYKKGLKGFKQNKDEHDMIRKAAIFRRTKLLLTIYNPWKKSYLKFKKLEFLIKSVIDFGRIVSMKKGIIAFKRYHQYLIKKEAEEDEAMKIYEDRKVEIFVRGFIEGSKGFFAAHSESEDLLKSEDSEESIDEVPQKVDVVQEKEPVVEEIPKPIIPPDSKPKPLPNSAPKFEIPEIVAPRRPSFLPAPNKPIVSNTSSPSKVLPSSPPCSPERLRIDNVITHQKAIPLEEDKPNNSLTPVESEKPNELNQKVEEIPTNDQKSEISPKIDQEKEVDPLTVELPPPKPLPQGISPVNASPKPLPQGIESVKATPQPLPMIPPQYEKSAKRTRQEVIELVIAFSKRLNEIQRQPITPELKNEASQIMNEIIQLKSELSVCL